MENCNKYQERISAFLDDMLPEDERLALMEHLAACPDCRQYFDDQIAIHHALVELDADAPAGFAQQVMDRVKVTPQDKPVKKTISFPVWRRWAATAACCAIAALGVLGLGGERSGTDDMHPQSAVSYSAVTASDRAVSMDSTPAEETCTVANSTADDMILYGANSTMTEAKSAAPSADTAPNEPAESPLQDTARETAADGSTLPGATEITPAVMVNGKIYAWDGMADGGIPDGYIYVSELTHVEGTVLSEDGQFISTFDARGQIYTHPDRPDQVYIQITTDWLDEEFVKFSLAE